MKDEDALGVDREVAVADTEVDAMLVGVAIPTLTTPMGHPLDTQLGKIMAEEDMEAAITMIVPMAVHEVALVITMALVMAEGVTETMVEDDLLLLLIIAVADLIILVIDPDLDLLVSITTDEDEDW